MNNIMQHEQTQTEVKRGGQSFTSNGITIAGFLLFLTGVILFSIGMIDILVHINSVKTAALLVGGIAAYKVGHMMIRHCATLRKRPERRRHLLSDNS
ncbi:hypothetical protein Q4520_02565 [Alteromonas sp. 1_MG-2023]|uniref:hypothetical protein n=1 Tax=unclassified Alteromonas TaxID=2614992 RepID=UPI0026E4083B|nr:hypothetical protein [Alteromonas sp. 1_MG-2023]MDO6474281.1 hypothetical protein [Alteromonas sp. 1_MG-2023]